MKHYFVLAREKEELLLVEGSLFWVLSLCVLPEPQINCLCGTLQHLSPHRSKIES